MDSRQRQDLDNYITGHHGEDQFREDYGDEPDIAPPAECRSEFWPMLSVHQEYAQRHILHDVYEYDPTDDGPECEVITRILASHPELEHRP